MSILIIVRPAMGRWGKAMDLSRNFSAKSGGPGFLNKISASISGASAGVKLPSGATAG